MPRYNLIATCAFGLESVVASELRELGYRDLKTEDGKVMFTGDDLDIARCNLWLRCADRLLIKMAEFKATDFEELFQGALAVKWEKLIPENGVMHVTGKSIRSKLYSVPDCQSIVKKAVVEAMKRKYNRTMFSETGPVYKIEIALLKDVATITVDTSGDGLHKRGYGETRGEAPLRETLAAALVRLSRWDPSRILADPLCGSGTIAIEAALIGSNTAPGLKRTFVAETWPTMPKKIWEAMRDEAAGKIVSRPMEIYASDMDIAVFRQAVENAERADVSEMIVFQKKPIIEFSSKKKYGCVITNPPYGERLGTKESTEKLYRAMGEVFSKLDTWSFFILTSHPEFQKYFGTKATKNRKLYNGKIKCYFYQYFGSLPKKQNKDI
ncbi:MAG: class I SAM-dependent RNA methyltransferase [Spirochaetes bacterium]|nr:class I SAM-dependent RNA methyltransferase [Spirochaetota bacterium]